MSDNKLDAGTVWVISAVVAAGSGLIGAITIDIIDNYSIDSYEAKMAAFASGDARDTVNAIATNKEEWLLLTPEEKEAAIKALAEADATTRKKFQIIAGNWRELLAAAEEVAAANAAVEAKLKELANLEDGASAGRVEEQVKGK